MHNEGGINLLILGGIPSNPIPRPTLRKLRQSKSDRQVDEYEICSYLSFFVYRQLSDVFWSFLIGRFP